MHKSITIYKSWVSGIEKSKELNSRQTREARQKYAYRKDVIDVQHRIQLKVRHYLELLRGIVAAPFYREASQAMPCQNSILDL